MIEPLLINLKRDFALLKTKIELGQGMGFTNHSTLLEALAIRIFKVLEIADLKSMDQIKVNFPAIDSADDSGDGLALQVTSNADATKIKKTIAAFEKQDASGKSLKDKYAKLYILGFSKASLKTVVPAYCKVIDTAFLLKELKTKNDAAKVQAVLNEVHQHENYAGLHPYGDVDCLRIVLQYLGRDAIRHRMSCEGSLDEMTKGLKEIKELIGKGSVNGKLLSKAATDFEDHAIYMFLSDVLNDIGNILAIVNKSRLEYNPEFVCLNPEDNHMVDLLKHSISQAAQTIATANNINMHLGMHLAD